MLTRRGRFVTGAAVAVAVCAATPLLAPVLSGCEPSAGTTKATSPSPSASSYGPTEPRAQLAARAASAKDRSFTATYSLSPPDRKARSIAVTVAADRSWRIDLTGGAVTGTAVTLIGIASGQYQCLPVGNKGMECSRVAQLGLPLADNVDPGVQHPFTDWLDVLTNPAVAIAVGRTKNPTGGPGDCFSVEATTVTLAPAIESSTFCYTDDGTLTAAQAAFGLLALSGPLAAAPKAIELPGSVTARSPLPMVTATASGRASPAARRDTNSPR